MFKIICLFLTMMLTVIIASCGTDSSAEQKSDTESTANDANVAKAPHYVTMPQNTSIAIVLIDSIDTDIQISGDGFRAELLQPIVVEGHTLFADGAEARGVLNKVVESGRLKTPAELYFTLTGIRNADGLWVNVSTNTIIEKKGTHTNREVAMIGGGAIVGGIIGKIINKQGSTEIGAATGAVVGTGLSYATGKQDIFHGAGTEVTFFSSRSMQVTMK